MHYYSFNIKEYTHATVHLTNVECLAYRRMLDICYDTEAPLPSDHHLVARRVRCDVAAVLNVLGEFFIHTDLGWEHPRVQKELEATYAKSEKARAAALLSVKTRKNQADAQRTLNERSTPVQLHNTQDIIPNTQKKKETASLFFPEELDTDEFEQLWNAYMAYRREMKMKTLRSSSVAAKFKEMAAWGHDQAITAISNSIANGWQGIFEPTGKPTGTYQKPSAVTESDFAHAF
jgi:uncharacterized protein YdaU (DUF1376 family)